MLYYGTVRVLCFSCFVRRKYRVPYGPVLPLSALAAWLPSFKVPAHVALVTYTGVLLGSSSGLVPDLNSERPLTSHFSSVLHI